MTSQSRAGEQARCEREAPENDKGVFWKDWEGYEDDGEVDMLPLTP
jgi:hypothetical protein